MITDGAGTPLAVLTTGANIPDISKVVDLLDAVPPIAGRPGRPRRRFPVLLADKGYDSAGSAPPAVTGVPSRSSRNAATNASRAWASCRDIVEQGIALLHEFRRLAIRWERHLDLHDALVSLGCALICWRRLTKHTTPRSC